MGNFIDNIKNVIPVRTVVFIGVAIALIVVLAIIRMILRKKKSKKLLNENEEYYNRLKGIPLAFKLNKAVALSRVNEVMAESVEQCKADFDDIQEKLKNCSVELAEIDDLIYIHKIKSALKELEQLEKELKSLDTFIGTVDSTLDEVLEKENEQRVHINKLKDEFRNLKVTIFANRASFAQTYEYLEMQIVSIEKMFSSFEEWMFASEFDKAADQQKEIKDKISDLKELVDNLPCLYERAKGILPRAIDEVGYAYAQCKNKGVYLEHLEVHKNLDFISDVLKECLNRLRNGKLVGVFDDLNDCEKRITQLEEQINKEEKAFDEIEENLDILLDSVKILNIDVENIIELYNRVYERFGFENWTERLKEVSAKLEILNDMERKLNNAIQEQKNPYTTILIAYKEVEQSVSIFNNEVAEMKQKLDTACGDEERAKKQLVKLQLILNEIRVNISKHRLPSVSNKYEDDLHRGEVMIREIQTTLDNSPLDVKRVNAELRKAIDYIYTLYNNVNNLVGMAIMVENAIVFGNRYRSTYADIDSELTRADLCFRNGQYTKALKISFQCIEKLHPGAYEKLIARKEPELLAEEI